MYKYFYYNNKLPRSLYSTQVPFYYPVLHYDQSNLMESLRSGWALF